jgi:hypothetical protein
VYASTDVSPWGFGDVKGFLMRNIITNNWMGMVLNESVSDLTHKVLVDISTYSADYNLIYDNDSSALYLENCNDSIDATYNYWGKSLVPQIEQVIYHQVDNPALGLVDFSMPYLLGDVNTDRVINLGDVVYLINSIFRGGPAPYILILGDTNRNGIPIELGDLVFLISYLYRGGPPPVKTTGVIEAKTTREEFTRPTPVIVLMK